MRLIVFLFISLIIAPSSRAQQSASDLMDRVKSNFTSQKEIAFDFNLTVSIPEQKDIVLNGSIVRSDSQFSATLGERWIKTDGKTQWVYDPDLGEVQIYDADEDNALPLSPNELLKIYNTNDFSFDITNREAVGDDQLVLIEFKPIDKSGQIVKASMQVYQSSALPALMKISERDGMQYTLEVENIDTTPSISPAEFTFDADKYPELKIEDLRGTE
jgi:outer membrane lipoprotein-sorting protein